MGDANLANMRQFYLEEAVKSNWSTRQLERQINSFFYERLLSSKNKEDIANEITALEKPKSAEDIIRDPYVLEFLGLSPKYDFYENDLEQALISHLQKFCWNWEEDFPLLHVKRGLHLMVGISE